MRLDRWVVTGVLAAAALIAGLPANAQAPGLLGAEVEAEILRTMKQNRIVGLSAAVLAGWEELLVRGYGLADRGRGLPAGPQTLFPVGSITKLFTATAMMQLVEQGLVDLDAPVSTYLEGFAPAPAPEQGPASPQSVPITVRQLLTHHAGLPSNHFAGFQPDAPDPRAFRELPAILSDEQLAAAPGEVFSYSNLGYALAGCIVEQVTGLPYAQYLRRHIFGPLGMSSAVVLDGALEAPSTVSLGYRGRQEVPAYAIRDIPAGAVLASAEDMAAFSRMILGKGRTAKARILSPESFAEMTGRQNGGVALDRDFSVGLGYWLIDPFGLPEPLASHGGDLPPFHAILITIPDAGLAVYLAANSESSKGVIIELASRIVKRVYEVSTGRVIPEPRLGAPITLDPTAARALAGTYASPMGLLEVRERAGRLAVRLQGLPVPLLLVPRDDPQGSRQWTLELRLLGLIRLHPAGLDALRVSPFVHAGRQYLGISAAGISAGAAQKLDLAPPHPDWIRRTGRYEIRGGSQGLGQNLRDLRLGYDRSRGLLVFSCRLVGQRMSFALRTLDGSRALIAGTGTGLGETLEWVGEESDAKGTPFLRWSGLRLVRSR